jgi:hypothetical protein
MSMHTYMNIQASRVERDSCMYNLSILVMYEVEALYDTVTNSRF